MCAPYSYSYFTMYVRERRKWAHRRGESASVWAPHRRVESEQQSGHQLPLKGEWRASNSWTIIVTIKRRVESGASNSWNIIVTIKVER